MTPNPLTIAQLDTVILRYADELEEALAAGDEARASLLLQLTDALQSRQAEVIDQIVGGLHGLSDYIALAQQRIDLYRIAKQKMEAAKATIEIHIKRYIEENLPEDNRRLDGHLFWLRSQKNTQDSLVLDETQIPRKYFVLRPTLVLPASVTDEQLDTLLAFLDEFIPGSRLEGLTDRPEPEVDEQTIRMELQAQLEVPGARLVRNSHLRVKHPKKPQRPAVETTETHRGQNALAAPAEESTATSV